MGLKIRDYHKELNSRIDETLSILNTTISDGEINVTLRINSIKPYARQLGTYCDATLPLLETISSGKLHVKVDKLKKGKVKYSDEAVTHVLQAALEGLIIAKRVLEKSKATIEEVSKHRVSYKVYKDILDIYNQHIIDELLKGRKVYLGNGFGSLFVKIIEGKSASDTNRINWKESIKRKAEILNRGGIPYITKDAKDCEAKGIPYLGEPWCVTSTIDNYPYIGWTGRSSTLYKEYYTFAATRDNNTGSTMGELLDGITCIEDINKLNVGIVKKLILYLGYNPKLIVNYLRKL